MHRPHLRLRRRRRLSLARAAARAFWAAATRDYDRYTGLGPHPWNYVRDVGRDYTKDMRRAWAKDQRRIAIGLAPINEW